MLTPVMFSIESPPLAPLKPYLLLNTDDEKGISHEFISEALKRSEEDDSIISAIVTAVEDMSRDLAKFTMDDDYKPYMMVSRGSI